MEKSKIRIVMEYEFRRKSTIGQTVRNMKDVFGDDAPNKSTISRWFEKFRSGDFCLENETRGRPETKICNDDFRAVVESDTRQTTKELATRFGVSIPTILVHLRQINKVKKLDRWIPSELTNVHKEKRFNACVSLLSRNKSDPFLHRIVTCDEKWILFDNRKRSAQWLDADERPKTCPKPKIHQRKLMVTVWWTSRGVIYHSFLKPGQSITAEVYCIQLEEMMKNLAKKLPKLANRDTPILLHDNARPHVANRTQLKILEMDLETIDHPPYSPDLSPTDYCLFQNLDNFLQGKIFKTAEAAQSAFNQFIESLKPEFFDKGISDLERRWQKCILSNGTYFD